MEPHGAPIKWHENQGHLGWFRTPKSVELLGSYNHQKRTACFTPGYTPQNKHGTQKLVVCRCFSFSKVVFPGSMFVFGYVPPKLTQFSGSAIFRVPRVNHPRTLPIEASRLAWLQLLGHQKTGRFCIPTPQLGFHLHGLTCHFNVINQYLGQDIYDIIYIYIYIFIKTVYCHFQLTKP